MAANMPHPLGFLSMPVELRLMIYRDAFPGYTTGPRGGRYPQTHVRIRRTGEIDRRQTTRRDNLARQVTGAGALLQTCRTIRVEALPFHYRYSRFYLTTDDLPTATGAIPPGGFPDIYRIRHALVEFTTMPGLDPIPGGAHPHRALFFGQHTAQLNAEAVRATIRPERFRWLSLESLHFIHGNRDQVFYEFFDHKNHIADRDSPGGHAQDENQARRYWKFGKWFDWCGKINTALGHKIERMMYHDAQVLDPGGMFDYLWSWEPFLPADPSGVVQSRSQLSRTLTEVRIVADVHQDIIDIMKYWQKKNATPDRPPPLAPPHRDMVVNECRYNTVEILSRVFFQGEQVSPQEIYLRRHVNDYDFGDRRSNAMRVRSSVLDTSWRRPKVLKMYQNPRKRRPRPL